MMKLPRFSLPKKPNSSPQEPAPVVIDERWRAVVEPITKFKDAIDVASRWKEAGESHWVKAALAEHGISVKDVVEVGHSKLSNFPDAYFSSSILGPCDFFESPQDCGWVLLPPWSTIGWSRNYPNIVTSSFEQASAAARRLDEEIAGGKEDNTSWSLSGLPIFCAGEGKNRALLQRRGDVFRRTRLLQTGEVPRINSLSALLFRSQILVGESDAGLFILPFRRLSEPFLNACGMEVSNIPSVRGWLTLLSQLRQRGQSFFLAAKTSIGPIGPLRAALLRRQD